MARLTQNLDLGAIVVLVISLPWVVQSPLSLISAFLATMEGREFPLWHVKRKHGLLVSFLEPLEMKSWCLDLGFERVFMWEEN